VKTSLRFPTEVAWDWMRLGSVLGYDTLDEVLEALGDKLQRTSLGTYIKVDDLRELTEQRAKEREESKLPILRPRTFEQANRMAKADPEFTSRFKDTPIGIEAVKS